MTKRTPPLHVLYAFESVARLTSFTRAAAELNVTRSAVSRRIQMLEHQLSEAVFERGTRSVMLTSTGAAYLITVRKALIALEDVAEQSGAAPRKKRLSLTMPPAFARMLMLPWLRLFLQQNQDIEVSVEISMSQLDYRVSDTDLDIRFGTGKHKAMESYVLVKEKVFPIASPTYIDRLGLNEPRDLARAHLLRSRLEPWSPWFQAAGLDWDEPDSGHRFEDLSLLYHAAEMEMGVALARGSLARSLLKSGAVRQLFETAADSPYTYHLVYNRDVLKRPEVARFVESLLAADLSKID